MLCLLGEVFKILLNKFSKSTPSGGATGGGGGGGEGVMNLGTRSASVNEYVSVKCR